MIGGAARTMLRCGALAFTAYEMGSCPVVLCLHGFPDTPLTFRNLLPALAAAGYRGVAVTRRGYEPSSQPKDGGYSLAALAEDVGAWLECVACRKAHQHD